MVNRKQTSPQIAELASAVLRNPKTSKPHKALAGSALAQAQSRGRGRTTRWRTET